MNIADNAQYGDFWSSVKNVAASIIPKKTIVGKLISGDTSGAISATANLVGAKVSTPKVPTMAAKPGLLAPGGFVDKNQTMLLATAGLGVAYLIFARSKRR